MENSSFRLSIRRDRVHENHPWILVRYVSGECAGISRPCKVGIQQILKYMMEEAVLSHIVKEIAFGTRLITSNRQTTSFQDDVHGPCYRTRWRLRA